MLMPTLWRTRGTPAWNQVLANGADVERVLDRFLRFPEDTALQQPVADVRETANEFQVSVELPGLTAEDVSVTLEQGMLTISGEKKQEVEEGKADASYHLVERRYGRFERSFMLPRTVAADGVTARFRDGVLTVVVPKAEVAKPRKIAVQ